MGDFDLEEFREADRTNAAAYVREAIGDKVDFEHWTQPNVRLEGIDKCELAMVQAQNYVDLNGILADPRSGSWFENIGDVMDEFCPEVEDAYDIYDSLYVRQEIQELWGTHKESICNRIAEMSVEDVPLTNSNSAEESRIAGILADSRSGPINTMEQLIEHLNETYSCLDYDV